MSTRNLIMVVDRKHSSKYPEGFAIHPDLMAMYTNQIVFVLKPEKIISKYMKDMEYTDFANGSTILSQRNTK